MPRRCTVCTHAEHATIDTALVAGAASLRSVASLFDVSEAALRRHKRNHLPATLARAQEAEEVVRSDTLLERLLFLNRETLAILWEARKANDNGLALRAIARAEKQIELQGRLLGELQDGTVVNVLVSPQWIGIRTTLLDALAPYPDAREAATTALLEFDSGERS